MQREIKLSYLILITTVVFLGIILLLVFVIQREPNFTEQLAQTLRQKFSESSQVPFVIVGNDTTHADTLLLRFYGRRNFQSAWINDKGPMQLADSLSKAVHEADFEGLNPDDYHVKLIDSLLSSTKKDIKLGREVSIQRMMDLEILLTDAFLLYGNHLLSGRVNPETIDPEWLSSRPEADLTEILTQAIASGQIQKTLYNLLPDLPCYNTLRREMVHYKSIAMSGGWPIVPGGTTLKKGDRGLRVIALSARLIMSGYMPDRPIAAKSVFDDTLEAAVRKFQETTGLKVTGEVSAPMIVILNKPTLDYVRKIEVNMERWRWLPRDLGQRYILVNIAAFSLSVIENKKTVMSMPVVVGRDYRQTPVFSANMTYLVLNPYWHVPPTIAVEDILPQVKKNPNYLVKRDIEVVRTWNDQIPIDPFEVDWSVFTKDNLPYYFRQKPGDLNALGRIKFMFPNKYDVYLHDTPQRADFDRTQRAYSSGCIRLSKPIDLAEYVLHGDPNWTRRAIVRALDSLVDYIIKLPEPIPVHIFYCTAWIDDDGAIHFRDDIYNRDVLVENALRAEMVLQE